MNKYKIRYYEVDNLLEEVVEAEEFSWSGMAVWFTVAGLNVAYYNQVSHVVLIKDE